MELADSVVTRLGPAGQNFWGLFPDGNSYLYSAPQNGPVLRRSLADGSEEVIRPSRASAAISADGSMLAFWFQDGKAGTISVKPAAGGPERTLISGVAGSVNRIAWSHDGRHVFFVSNNRELWRIPIDGGDAIDTGVRIANPKRISVSPDGSQIALTGGAASAEVWLWENLLPKGKRP